jgi:hypothetical protein
MTTNDRSDKPNAAPAVRSSTLLAALSYVIKNFYGSGNVFVDFLVTVYGLYHVLKKYTTIRCKIALLKFDCFCRTIGYMAFKVAVRCYQFSICVINLPFECYGYFHNVNEANAQAEAQPPVGLASKPKTP